MKQEAILKPPRVMPWPWIAFAALIPAMFLIPIGHDAIWQMWVGRQLWHGAEFGKDVIEINPPLWFWIAAPIAGLGEGIPTPYLVVGLFAASIGLSLYLIPNRYRLPSLVAFVLLPLIDFGQREQFVLITTAPYAFLISQRVKGEDPKHPLLIGLFAALGFALKPYFVIVPIALELLAWKAPRVRPETGALFVCANLYALAVLALAPAYLRVVVPEAMIYYPYFHGLDKYGKTFVVSILLAVAGVLVGRRKGSPETKTLALTALAFIPAVYLQGKGWTYQTIPVRGFLFLAVAAEMIRERKNPYADSLLLGAALLSFWPLNVYKNAWTKEAGLHLVGLRPGTTVMGINSNPSLLWPAVDQYPVKWASKQFSIWQLSAAAQNPKFMPAAQRAVQIDMANKPEIILVDQRGYFAPIIRNAFPTLPGYRLRKKTRFMLSYERIQ